MNKIIFAIAAILLSTQADAQVPGYMGKRFSLGVNMRISPAFLHPVSTKDSLAEYEFLPAFRGINKSLDFHADFILSRRGTVGARIATQKTAYYFENRPYIGSTTFDWALVGLKSTRVSAFYQWGKRNSAPAPVGKYFRLELAYIFYKMDDVMGQITRDTAVKARGFYAKGGTPALFLTFGRQYVVANSVVLNWGLQYGFVPFNPFFRQEDYTSFMMNFAQFRLAGAGAFNLEMGAAYMIR